MTSIAHFLPFPSRATTGADSSSQDATGLPSGRTADAWRREMERQQQLSWFLPALPAPAGLAWAAPPLAPPLATTREEGAATPDVQGPAPVAPPHADDMAPKAHTQAARTRQNFDRQQNLSARTATAAPAPAGNDTQVVDAGSPAARGTFDPGSSDRPADRDVRQGAAAAVQPIELRGSPGAAVLSAARVSSLFSTESVSRAIQSLAAQASGIVDAAVAQPPVAQRPGEPDATSALRMTVATFFDHATGSAPDPLEADTAPATTTRPAARDPAPPLRVHCDWQDGQLTVWIGHDRGHAESAAVLVQAIERWLMSQRLPSAGFVVNGGTWRKDDAAHTSHATAHDATAAEEPTDHSPTRTPTPTLRSAHTSRENA